MSGKGTITVKLKRCITHSGEKHKATITGLGLRRMNHQVTLENTSAVRGMIKKVIHLVEVVAEGK